MSSTANNVVMADGNKIPQLGLGVWQASQEQARMAVAEAIRAGYRHIDTAAIYKNEEGVGAGLRDVGVAREDVFITTKVWNADHGYDNAKKALHESLSKLNVDYVDMLLIHWPLPKKNQFVDTWKALIDAKESGKVKSIGVSNFNPEHIQRLIDETGVPPVIDQVEAHPSFQQKSLRESLASMNVLMQAWSPLGQGKAMEHLAIQEIAHKYGKTAAQVVIRWHIELGNIVIPKSVTPERIRQNFEVFDFSLDGEDMKKIADLQSDNRMGPDPLTMDME